MFYVCTIRDQNTLQINLKHVSLNLRNFSLTFRESLEEYYECTTVPELATCLKSVPIMVMQSGGKKNPFH